MVPCDNYPRSDWSFRLLSFLFYDSRSRSSHLTTNARPNTDKGPTTEIRWSENFALIVPLASATRLPKSPTWLQMRNKNTLLSNIKSLYIVWQSLKRQHEYYRAWMWDQANFIETWSKSFALPCPPPTIPLMPPPSAILQAINTGVSLTEIGLEVLHGKDWTGCNGLPCSGILRKIVVLIIWLNLWSR